VFGQLYDFAEENGITFVGGTDRTVGGAGGWVQVLVDFTEPLENLLNHLFDLF
jgi:hypothetical protein